MLVDGFPVSLTFVIAYVRHVTWKSTQADAVDREVEERGRSKLVKVKP